jgi:hypothetical protein
MPAAVLSAGPVLDELAARVASGPAFWADWVDDLDRGGLLEELPGRDAIGRALAEAPGPGQYDSALNAKMTLVCVLVGCLFPGEGYDQVLARAFGIPACGSGPGRSRRPVPCPRPGSGSASTSCPACSRSTRKHPARSSG